MFLKGCMVLGYESKQLIDDTKSVIRSVPIILTQNNLVTKVDTF